MDKGTTCFDHPTTLCGYLSLISWLLSLVYCSRRANMKLEPLEELCTQCQAEFTALEGFAMLRTHQAIQGYQYRNDLYTNETGRVLHVTLLKDSFRRIMLEIRPLAHLSVEFCCRRIGSVRSLSTLGKVTLDVYPRQR